MDKEIFVGRDDEGLKYYVHIRLGPDPLNTLEGKETTEHDITDSEPLTLSITYSAINPSKRGENAWESGGAGVHLLPKMVTKPVDAALVSRMAEVAERWHLNGMAAQCAHQTIVYEDGPYGRPQPSLTLTEPCPITGYKYGHDWLVEILPDEIVKEIQWWDTLKVDERRGMLLDR